MRNLTPPSRSTHRALYFLTGVGAVLALRLLWVGLRNGMDFEVYWQAAVDWQNGRDFYRLNTEHVGFVFKYPPWILPLFLPLSLLSLQAAQAVWACVEFAALLAVFFWVWRTQDSVRFRLGVVLSALFYWWLWLGHFYAGQWGLILTAGVLWAWSFKKPEWVLWLLSAKAHALVALAMFSREAWTRKSIRWSIRLVVLGTLIAWARYPGAMGDGMFAAWLRAARSGEELLGWDTVWGQGNHGFPALFVRAAKVLHPDLKQTGGSGQAFFIAAHLIGAAVLHWRLKSWGHSPGASRASRSALTVRSILVPTAWLALVTVLSPLAWHHGFVLCFPLQALALAFALESQDRNLMGLAFLGIVATALVIPQTFGSAAVRIPELLAMKSWGVLLSFLSLDRQMRRRA